MLDELVERRGELARRWAVALILARPVEGIGAVPLEEIALEGPTLCAQVLRALQSDAELDRLTGAGPATGREQSAPARRLAAVAGAENGAEVVAAAEALRGVLWEALTAASGEVQGRMLADVSDRLAHVCAASAAAAMESVAGAARAPGAPGLVDFAAAEPARTRAGAANAPAPAPASGAVIVDESARAAAANAGPRPPAAEIEIRDVRGADGPKSWVGAIGGELDRFAADGRPFSVLLVEAVEGAERSGVDELLRRELRRAGEGELDPGTLTRERPGRYWLLARGRDRQAGQELADRLMGAARMGAAPLVLAVGIASCPQDGTQAAALAAHADVGLYAARAALRAASIVGPAAASIVDRP